MVVVGDVGSGDGIDVADVVERLVFVVVEVLGVVVVGVLVGVVVVVVG